MLRKNFKKTLINQDQINELSDRLLKLKVSLNIETAVKDLKEKNLISQNPNFWKNPKGPSMSKKFLSQILLKFFL